MRYSHTLISSVLLSVSVAAQAGRGAVAVTADDYARAERFLSATTTGLVSGVISRSTWLDDGRLLYRCSIPGGTEFVLVDPQRRSRARAFDHARLAEALSHGHAQAKLPVRT